MNYLVINGSGKGKKSGTLKLTRKFIQGIKNFDSAATFEILHLADIAFDHCSGCFSCWIAEIAKGKWRTVAGKCKLNDDFFHLMNNYNDASRVIFCTPIYFFNISSLLQKFIERTLPLGHRFYFSEHKDPNDTHDSITKDAIIICTYFKYIDQMFDGIRNQMQFLNDNMQEIFVPSAMLKFQSLDAKTFFDSLDKLIFVAGYEFAKNDFISSETAQKLSEYRVWR